MKACIYARTARGDKSHKRMSLDNQVEHCRELARRHNLTVDFEHVYTDIDAEGDTPPSCWVDPGVPARPALAALIRAVDEREVRWIIVARVERLATSSALLQGLLELCLARDAYVVASPEQSLRSEDPGERFAVAMLRARLAVDSGTEREARAQLRTRKIEEIGRLQEKIARLEADVAALGEREGP